MKRLNFYGYLFPLGAFLYPVIGLAQAPEAAIDPALAQGADLVFDKIARGEWWPAAGALVSLLTLFIHSPLAKRLPEKVQAVLVQPLVNFFTPVLLSALGGLATMMASGHTDWKAYAAGVGKSAMAAGFAFLLFKNGAEQLAGGVPKPPPMVIALLVGAGLALAPLPARAQSLTVGPSLPAVAVTPGATHPVSLSPGAGISVGVGLFPSTLVGKPVHMLGVAVDVFGAVLPSDGQVSGNFSVALHAAVFELLTVGVGLKLASTDGYGAFTGKLDHRSIFLLIGIDDLLLRLMNVGHEAPPVEQACDGDHPCGAPGS